MIGSLGRWGTSQLISAEMRWTDLWLWTDLRQGDWLNFWLQTPELLQNIWKLCVFFLNTAVCPKVIHCGFGRWVALQYHCRELCWLAWIRHCFAFICQLPPPSQFSQLLHEGAGGHPIPSNRVFFFDHQHFPNHILPIFSTTSEVHVSEQPTYPVHYNTLSQPDLWLLP